jgi:hypothetical protein
VNIGDLVRELIAAGCDPAVAADAVTRAYAEGAASVTVAPVRTARQERNHRYYEARKERLKASEKRLNASETSELRRSEAAPTEPYSDRVEVNISSHPSGAHRARESARGTPPRKHVWPDDWREQLAATYPKRTGLKPGLAYAEKLFRADRTPWDVIAAGVERLATNREPQFCPELGRWLREERWNDTYPEPAPTPTLNGSHYPARSPPGNQRPTAAEVAQRLQEEAREQERQRDQCRQPELVLLPSHRQ